jgi:hypothetical protein
MSQQALTNLLASDPLSNASSLAGEFLLSQLPGTGLYLAVAGEVRDFIPPSNCVKPLPPARDYCSCKLNAPPDECGEQPAAWVPVLCPEAGEYRPLRLQEPALPRRSRFWRLWFSNRRLTLFWLHADQRFGWLREINFQMFVPPVTFFHFREYSNNAQGKP